MLINFDKVIIQNFRSFGNNPIEFDFKNGIDRITGLNGQGKTTVFIHSLVYALYGVGANGEKLNELINNINKKDMQITLFLHNESNSYKIIRGRNPNILKVYKDDIEVESNDLESYIKDEILKGISLNTFISLFAVQANAKAYSFFRMGKTDRRKAIEELFDLSLVNDIKALCKESLDELDKKSFLLNSQVENESKFLEDMCKKNIIFDKEFKDFRQKKDKAIEEANKKITESKALLEKIKFTDYTKEINNLTALIEKGKAKYAKYIANKSLKPIDIEPLNKRLEEINEKIWSSGKFRDLINHTCSKDCPTRLKFGGFVDVNALNIEKKELEKKILDSNKNNILVAQHKKDAKEFQDYLDELKALGYASGNEVNKKLQALTEAQKKEVENKKKIDLNTALIKSNSEIIKSFDKAIPKKPFDEKEISDLDKKLKKDKKDQTEINEKKSVHDELFNFLKKDNLKYFMVRKSFVSVKRECNKLLKEFFVDTVRIDFNKDLEPILFRNGDEVSYSSFSDGEKKRVDFAFVFGIREFIKGKDKIDTNILILDEILDTSLDKEGVEALLNYLEQIDNQNTIIITHRNVEMNNNRSFIIEKNKRFSEIKVA